MNGYQMLQARDGAEVGKTSPSFDLHLDSNKGVSPISLRLAGGFDLLQPKNGPASPSNPTGSLPNNFPCCNEGNSARIYAGGTVEQDMAYFISFKLGDSQLDQGFVRFANIFGNGYMGFDFGAIRTADSEAVSPNREWFAAADTAYYGTANVGGRDQGRSIGYSDAGARIFGNPNYGPFSYDIVMATGVNATTSPANTRGSAYGFLGRVDSGDFSGSLRYWSNKTSSFYFTKQGPFFNYSTTNCANNGNPCFAPPDLSANTDESTQDFIFSADYDTDRWQVDLVYLFNDFNLANRTDANGNTYQRDNIRRTGASASWIYRFGSRLAFGARYGFSSMPAYNEAYNGVTALAPSATASQLEFKLELTPVQNAKISLEWLFDTSSNQARTDVYGNSYVQQSKMFLLWDWAI